MGINGGTGDSRIVNDPTNPNLALLNNSGRQAGIDQPHQTKIIASYQAPWDVTLGTIYQGLSGSAARSPVPRDADAGLDDRAGRATAAPIAPIS